MRIRASMTDKKQKKRSDRERNDHARQQLATAAVSAAQDSRKRAASRALSPGSLPAESADGSAPSGPRSAAPSAAGAPPPPPPPAQNPPGPSSEPTLAQIMAQLVKLTDALAGLSAQSSRQGVELTGLREALAASEDRAKAAEDRAQGLEAKLADGLARADRRQEGLDREMRRDKMVFFGIPEGSDTSAEAQVESLLRAVGCPASTKVADAHRLGAARAPTGAAPAAGRTRPVRVTFTTASAVFDTFKACKALREQKKVFVDRDLTAQQRAVRTSLMGEYKQLRENGLRAFWRGERLFYVGDRGSRAEEVHPGDDLPTTRRQGASPSPPPGLA